MNHIFYEFTVKLLDNIDLIIDNLKKNNKNHENDVMINIIILLQKYNINIISNFDSFLLKEKKNNSIINKGCINIYNKVIIVTLFDPYNKFEYKNLKNNKLKNQLFDNLNNYFIKN